MEKDGVDFSVGIGEKGGGALHFVRQACGGDEEMVREFEEWLAAKSDAGSSYMQASECAGGYSQRECNPAP